MSIHSIGLLASFFAFLRYFPYLSCGENFGGAGLLTALPHFGHAVSLRVYDAQLVHLYRYGIMNPYFLLNTIVPASFSIIFVTVPRTFDRTSSASL